MSHVTTQKFPGGDMASICDARSRQFFEHSQPTHCALTSHFSEKCHGDMASICDARSPPTHGPLTAHSLPTHCPLTDVTCHHPRNFRVVTWHPFVTLAHGNFLSTHGPLTAHSRPTHGPLTAHSLPTHCALTSHFSEKCHGDMASICDARSPPTHGPFTAHSLPKYCSDALELRSRQIQNLLWRFRLQNSIDGSQVHCLGGDMLAHGRRKNGNESTTVDDLIAS